jgi:DNA polymerase I
LSTVILDIEANGLRNPTKVWVIVCHCVEDGKTTIFRGTDNGIGPETAEEFRTYAKSVKRWVGHNVLEYDFPVLNALGILPSPDVVNVIDTLIISRLVDYSREGGHSIEQYGTEFGEQKIKFNSWGAYSQEMEDYCVRDVHIASRVYTHYRSVIDDPDWNDAIVLEHNFQRIVNDLHDNGFAFSSTKASRLLSQVTKELTTLDKEILDAFPKKLVPVREIHPRLTKYGTLNRADFRWYKGNDFTIFSGGPFTLCRWQEFNPASHKQLIHVLNAAGWRPTERTQSHIETEREIARQKRNGIVDKSLTDKLEKLKVYGWKINEENLSTLPSTCPAPARLLAKRILYESRRRTLQEWLDLVQTDGRIHGKFLGIGAWTHRMAHRQPNTANIPREFREDGSVKLLGKELRELWCAPPKRLLVGVDAEGIQLRIFAHYIDDQEFTDALIRGKKSDKTDPHSLNQRILGSHCKTRQAAKRFIYALLLGGGINKLAQILDCDVSQAKDALSLLLQRYTGFARLRKTSIPKDAKAGYFIGLDGRKVYLPGESQRDREHLAMSGYLQNGEAIIIKKAATITKGLKFVNIVHDEYQVETSQKMSEATKAAEMLTEAIREAGEYYKLKCPLAGSYWNDDHNDYTIGTNWYATH